MCTPTVTGGSYSYPGYVGTNMYTLNLYMPCICIYHLSVFTLYLYVPCIYIYPVSVYTLYLYIPCIGIYPVSVYTLFMYMPSICIYPVHPVSPPSTTYQHVYPVSCSYILYALHAYLLFPVSIQ